MICPACAVADSNILPSIIYHIPRQRNIGLILLPASYALKQSNLALTTALRRNDVLEIVLERHDSNKCSAPAIFICNKIVYGKYLLRVVKINDLMMLRRVLDNAKPSSAVLISC